MTNIKKYTLTLVKESSHNYNIDKQVTSPKAMYEIVNSVFHLDTLAEEVFCILVFDTKNKVIGAFEVSHGSLNSSIVHPREVFKRALLLNGASIALAHNHPSGNPKPSEEDIKITKRLVEAGNILGIKVLDHIIVGEDYFLSFTEEGLI